MPTKQEWLVAIKENRGETGGVYSDPTMEYIDARWFYRNPNDAGKDKIRNRFTREMRKDGWVVKTTTNSLGWFLSASRRKEV